MPHVNVKGIDWVVSIFVVHSSEPMVLLVDHKKLGSWFGIGGHIGDTDPYQTPDEAVDEEMRTESGLEYEIVEPPNSLKSRRPPFNPAQNQGSTMMHTPWAVEQHDFPGVEGHKHMCHVYLARAKSLGLKLSAREHKDIRWFTHHDLDRFLYRWRMLDSIRWYAHEAINELAGTDYDWFEAQKNLPSGDPEKYREKD
jgi:hypothetical protein